MISAICRSSETVTLMLVGSNTLVKVWARTSVLGWAVNLNLYLDDSRSEQPLLVAGLAYDQAKPLLWRCEQYTPPAVLLTDASLASYLRSKLHLAEVLEGQLSSLGRQMLADSMPDPGHKDTRAKARAVLSASAATPAYFTLPERSLPGLLRLIAAGDGEGAEQLWSKCLLEAAERYWTVLSSVIGEQGLGPKVQALGWPKFCGLVRELRPARPDASQPTETPDE